MMRNVVLLHFAQFLLTSVLTGTADDVHRIWYRTKDDLDTSDDVTHEDSNIIEVRVLPDPDFVPPSFINYDRQGLSNDDLKTVSRTISKISTRIEVSSGENKINDHDPVVNEFHHFKHYNLMSLWPQKSGSMPGTLHGPVCIHRRFSEDKPQNYFDQNTIVRY